ncbi:unnamed protein product [marine sediment metagenome]|uniref:Acylphosphatase-like domain-containing protein n=1 Tax=marine sediment metagenome TaxID=412755 RepID=X1MBH5_9ZZZZ
MKKQVIIKIYGQVQGVAFRYYTQDVARKLNLVGWVRNEGDGSVTIVAAGEKDKLKKFIDWCHNGPSIARIDKVEVKWMEPEAAFDDFSIRY